MRIVGSMTTLPDRISFIKTPIKYILRQSMPLDILYLHIPIKTLKNKEYTIPSDFLDDISGFRTKVIINRCNIDYGPITKLAPVLDIEKDPDTYIITFDDDIIVHKDVIKHLRDRIQKYERACVGFSGICTGSFPFYFQYVIDNNKDHPVDWIQGVHVVMYKRDFFTNLQDLITFGDNTPLKDVLVFNDDHRISAYLASRNVVRISIGYNIKDYLYQYHNTKIEALSSDMFKLLKHHTKIITYFSKKGLYNHTYNCNVSLFFIIIMSMILYYMIFSSLKKIQLISRIIITTLLVIIYLRVIRVKYGLKSYKITHLLRS